MLFKRYRTGIGRTITSFSCSAFLMTILALLPWPCSPARSRHRCWCSHSLMHCGLSVSLVLPYERLWSARVSNLGGATDFAANYGRSVNGEPVSSTAAATSTVRSAVAAASASASAVRSASIAACTALGSVRKPWVMCSVSLPRTALMRLLCLCFCYHCAPSSLPLFATPPTTGLMQMNSHLLEVSRSPWVHSPPSRCSTARKLQPVLGQGVCFRPHLSRSSCAFDSG